MGPTKRTPLWAVIAFLAVGAGLLGVGMWDLVNAVRSVWWPTVPGTITSSEVMQRTGGRRATVYEADIRYRFSIDGRDYTGDQIWFGQHGNSLGHSPHQIVDTYPTGREVTIAYDPDDPEWSVLEPGVFPSVGLIPGIGLLFAGAGTLMFLDWRRKR